jgi:small subunit ribosomal protein S17
MGLVVSNKMDKTVVVAVEERHPNPKYGKIQIKTVKFKAHDEHNACLIGDTVEIEESRPYSAEKTWRVIQRVKEAATLQEVAV